ncbi:MAG TPA: hypothetical protein QF353_06530 [Gammaproteobacteria bacterium]|nr:hypothetical protein [Gammaproteobacteria bacterium]
MFLDQHLQLIKIIIGGAPIWTPFTAVVITVLERLIHKRKISTIFLENLVIYCVIVHCFINFVAGIIESSLISTDYLHTLMNINPFHFGHLSLCFIGLVTIHARTKVNRVLCACSIIAFYAGIGCYKLQLGQLSHKAYNVIMLIYFIVPALIFVLALLSKPNASTSQQPVS